jgi:shikimate 5-dehydrogenase
VDADVIVNCTSIGMWPNVDDTPLDEAKLSARQAVFDTIYNPIETRLLRQAKEAGGITIDGVTMFVNQAVAQFDRWTGQSAPVQVMRDVVLTKLSC